MASAGTSSAGVGAPDAVSVPKVSAYRVSTITTNGAVGAELAIAPVFHNLPILAADAPSTEDGFLFAEMMLDGVLFRRGTNPRASRRRRKIKATAATATAKAKATASAVAADAAQTQTLRFINQTTVVYRMGTQTPNIKIFANGVLHMTGIKNVNAGSEIVDRIIDALRAIPHALRFPDATLKNTDYVVRMINVDFKIDGWGINRDKLFSELDASTHLKLVYEANTYQALKVHYYFNESSAVLDGCCSCHAATDPTLKCEGKGKGVVATDCKRVTLAVFGTGKMMIIGASSMAQVDHVHAYAQRMIDEHFAAVRVPLRR